MTAATYVGSASGGAAATTLTCGAPSGVVSGDHQLAIVCLEITGETITAVPSGWTLISRVDNSLDSGDSMATAVYRSTTATGSSSWTKSGSRSGWVVRLAWRGGDGLNTGTAVSATRAASTSVALPTCTTTTVDSLVIGVVHVDDETGGTSTFTPPSGWTERFDSSAVYGGERHSVGVFEIERATAGAQTGTVGHSRSMRSTVYAIALDGILSTQTVTVPGIASAEAFGTPVLTAGPVSVAPSGIPSAEAFGTPQVNLTVYPAGIASAEAFGSPTVVVGGLVSPTGIPSAEAFGTPTVTPGAVTLLPTGIPSGEAFGTANVANVISPGGIPSSEAFGTPAVVVGAVTVTVTGIPSAEAFGAAALSAGPVTVSPTGIASGEAFGSPSVSMRIYLAGIPSGETFGTAVLTTGPVTVSPTGIPSEEAFGEPSFSVTIDLARLAGLIDTTQSGYELQCIARIPQQTGPPALLVVDRIKWKGLRYADVLSQPQELAATVQVASISDLVAQRLLGPDRQATELRLLRDGQIVAAGPLAGWHRRGPDVELVAGGLLSYTQRMIVLADMRFDQVDQHLIAAALIDQWQNSSYGHGHYGIDTSRVSASGRLRDRSYVRNEQHRVAQRIEELGAVDGGFDAEVDPTTRQLQLWHPLKGVDRSSGPSAVVLDRRVIASPDVMCSVAPGDLASLAFGTSSSAGSDGGLSSFQVNAELAASFGLSAVMGAWQDVSEQATLDDHVRALLDARSHALIVPGPRMRVTPDADLGTYDVGDTVQLELGTDQLGLTGAYRIRKRSVQVTETGVESVDLELV